MTRAEKIASELKDTDFEWGTIGPGLVHRLAMEQKDKKTFTIGTAREYMPISYAQIKILHSNNINFNHEHIKTVHLYNEVWRQNNMTGHSQPPAGSLLEHLIRVALA